MAIRFRVPRGWTVLTFVCATLLAAAQTFAGAPFRTDDPETVEFQHFEINLTSLGTKNAGGWSGVLPGVDVNYGAAPNLQLHMLVPVGYTSPQAGQTGFGMGDIEIGAKYRLFKPEEDDWFPAVAVFPLVEVPVGNQHLGLSTGHVQVFLPIWLQKEFEPWTVFGGGGYWINPGIHNKDWAFFGVALSRKVTDQLSVGIEVFHQTSSADGVKESTGMNVGATYDFSETWHLLTSVGTGIQNRRATNEFSYYVALQLTF